MFNVRPGRLWFCKTSGCRFCFARNTCRFELSPDFWHSVWSRSKVFTIQFPGSQADYQNNRNPKFWRWEDSLLNENSRLGENDFWYFHPYLGNWSNLTNIFFGWVGSKPPTKNPIFFVLLVFQACFLQPPNKRSVLIVHPIITLDSQSKVIQKDRPPWNCWWNKSLLQNHGVFLVQPTIEWMAFPWTFKGYIPSHVTPTYTRGCWIACEKYPYHLWYIYWFMNGGFLW